MVKITYLINEIFLQTWLKLNKIFRKSKINLCLRNYLSFVKITLDYMISYKKVLLWITFCFRFNSFIFIRFMLYTFVKFCQIQKPFLFFTEYIFVWWYENEWKTYWSWFVLKKLLKNNIHWKMFLLSWTNFCICRSTTNKIVNTWTMNSINLYDIEPLSNKLFDWKVLKCWTMNRQ